MNNVIFAPSSKSDFQREIVASLISKGKSVLYYNSICDDVITCLRIAEQFGAKVDVLSDRVEIYGDFNPTTNHINFGESGFALRVFSILATAKLDKFCVEAKNTLANREQKELINVLCKAGFEVSHNSYRTPIEAFRRRILSDIEIDASETSQVFSGLLFLISYLHSEIRVNVNNPKSKPYIDMTINTLAKRGVDIDNQEYKSFALKAFNEPLAIKTIIDGCWSSASFWIIAGAVIGGIEVKGLFAKSLQADKAILDILLGMKADIEIIEDSILIKKSKIKSININAENFPDLIPNLVILSAFANSDNRISGISRLVNKESNRAEAILSEFPKIGINIKSENDAFIISPSEIVSSVVNSFSDHRLVMAFELAGLLSGKKIEINNKDCVSKSYPDFYSVLNEYKTKNLL